MKINKLSVTLAALVPGVQLGSPVAASISAVDMDKVEQVIAAGDTEGLLALLVLSRTPQHQGRGGRRASRLRGQSFEGCACRHREPDVRRHLRGADGRHERIRCLDPLEEPISTVAVEGRCLHEYVDDPNEVFYDFHEIYRGAQLVRFAP